MENNYYKLEAKEIRQLVDKKIITSEQATELIETSLKRKPSEFADDVLKICIDKRRKIYINSIHFYGGENFNRPYFFLAELTCETTFRRFYNFCFRFCIPIRIFTY